VSAGRGEWLDRLRALPLEAVLPLCGGERDRHDPRKWRTPVGTLSVNGPKFMNWSRGLGGGGAIDLVIHLKNVGFREAVEWLAGNFGRQCLLLATSAALSSPLRLPPPAPENLERVKAYLALHRRIPRPLIETLIGSGALYADRHANAVFLLLGKQNNPVGAELRGTTTFAWRGMAPGSSKDRGCFAVGPATAPSIILCESAIDAVSCFVLHPQSRCCSTSGARPDPPWLDSLLHPSARIYCGFDADPTGDRMAQAMIARYPTVQRLRPKLKDWNDVLTAPS